MGQPIHGIQRWVAKISTMDFSASYKDALAQKSNHNWDEPYDVKHVLCSKRICQSKNIMKGSYFLSPRPESLQIWCEPSLLQTSGQKFELK